MEIWNNQEIENILLELESRGYPFADYSFEKDGEGLNVLGHGAFAKVYGASLRKNSSDMSYAIKVIGFGSKLVDEAAFESAVDNQERLSKKCENIIRIYDKVQLWIIFDEDEHVQAIQRKRPLNRDSNFLHLQFILMERSSSVFARGKDGTISLYPHSLNEANEKEILKLAFDIGMALEQAHSSNILHRDVKLENIFYSQNEGIYKLGDFGISRMTEDGAADTVAFTKGYGAPEVVMSLDDRYDNTADIYSYGMMLFVLANRMKFPDSDGYSVNAKLQYNKGYVLPEIKTISAGLNAVIQKLCSYSPDARFQSMKHVLTQIEKLLYGRVYAYRRAHKEGIGIVAAVYLILLFLSESSSSNIGFADKGMFIPLIPICLEYGLLCLNHKSPLVSLYRKGAYWGIIFVLLFVLIQIPYFPLYSYLIKTVDFAYFFDVTSRWTNTALQNNVCWCLLVSAIRVITSRFNSRRLDKMLGK